jgi:hypothetical protein
MTSHEFERLAERFKEVMGTLEHAKDTKTRRQALVEMRGLIREADRFLVRTHRYLTTEKQTEGKQSQ